MEKENIALVFFIALFVFSISMIGLGNSQLTGYATSGSAVSNVTISSYLSITMSTNLTSGILFGTISSLPVTDANATHNYDGPSSESSMFLNVSTDSNTAVDFCIKANAALTDSASGGTIGLGNETYGNSTTSNLTVPPVGIQTELTTSYVKAQKAVGQGNVTYNRFWLDVPVAVAPATYNNSISFKGVPTGDACGA